MGATFRQTADAVIARYNRLWEQADAEFDRYGEISKATQDALRDAELDMSLMGI